MKATRAQLVRALAAPGAIRLFLLYGPDQSGSRALGAELAKALGAAAERIDLAGVQLQADPARLADEAAAIGLFGGVRHVRVDPAGEETLAAVDALLSAPAAGNPVVMIAGALRKDSRLLQRALAADAAMAFASYPAEGRDAELIAIELAREAGLRMQGDLARRLTAATGGDRALIAQEIAKLALYVDAAPDRPRDIDHAALDALGADSDEGGIDHLVDAVLDGALDAVVEQLARIGQTGITELRALLRRMLLLAQMRAAVDRGSTPTRAVESAGRTIFWRDREHIAQQLARWSGSRLSTAIGRIAAVERAMKAGGSAGPVLADAEFLTIAREAGRRR